MEELPVTHPDFSKWRRGLRVNDPQAMLAKQTPSPDIIVEPIPEPVIETPPLTYPDEAPVEPEPKP